MLPVEHLAPRIIIAVDHCWRQIAQRLLWTAPAYHKKEGATPHLGAQKQSLQYDRIGVLAAGWDVEYRQSEWKWRSL